MIFYGAGAALLALFGLLAGYGPVADFLATGTVPRLPRAVLAAALMILSALSLASGLILDSLTRGRREIKRLVYLQQPWAPLAPGG